MTPFPPRYQAPATLQCTKVAIPMFIGGAAASVLALGCLTPWTLASLCAALLFGMSYFEAKPVVLLLVASLPIDVTLGPESPVRDLAPAFHVLIFAGLFLGRLTRNPGSLQRLFQSPITRAAVGFMAVLALSMVIGTARQPRAALRGIWFIGSHISVYLTLSVWLQDRSRLKQAMVVLIWTLPAVGAFALSQLVSGDYTSLWHFLYSGVETTANSIEGTGRVASFLGHPNHLAGYLNLSIPLALACFARSEEPLPKFLSAVAAFCGFVALALTQSRGGYLAVAVTCILALWYFVHTISRRILLTVTFLATLLGIYLLLPLLNAGHFHNFSDDYSVLTRVLLWSAAWILFLSSPIYGVGFGAFPLISDQYIPRLTEQLAAGLNAHNVYLELLAETGVLGLAAFLLIAARLIRITRRNLRSPDWVAATLSFGAFSGVIAILIHSVFEHDLLWAAQTGALFWCVAALGTAAQEPHPTQRGKQG